MPNRDWAAIREAWEHRGHRSIAQLALQFGVNESTLRYRAARDRWAKPTRNLRLTGAGFPTGTVRARCHDCGAVYQATLTRDGASPHCAPIPLAREA